ncbi:MAG: hypothetical protein JXR91_10170 [Deltaproteobacteria bacterium]|nr:hypothetical protein [Deltaproteobacteria bacterium]
MPGGIASVGSMMNAVPQIKNREQAAAAFEAMLMKQLFGEMSKTVQHSGLMGGNGYEASLYQDMFSGALAENATGSNNGLSEMIRKSFGIDDSNSVNNSAGKGFSLNNAQRGMGVYKTALTGIAEPPQNLQLSSVANNWIGGDTAMNWGKQGILTADDLGADISTPVDGGVAKFNIDDAMGYEGYPKCNLFAFEMLRRSDFTVPVNARSHGWGYPGAEAVTKMAQKGEVGNWADVKSDMSKEQLNTLASSGQPLLLVSDGIDKPGHMAVADKIYSINRDEAGNIATVEYGGWEAGNRSAGYGRKVWRLNGVSGSGLGGLAGIEILAPKKVDGVKYEPVSDKVPGASINDANRDVNMVAARQESYVY